jgi:hypothetical protein
MLDRPMGVLHLVVYRAIMLTDDGLLVFAVGLVLASAAGFSQLFSP